MERESCKDFSYDGCHNMNLLTMQEAHFVSILNDKLVDSELVRKYSLFHGTRDWLPCYRITKNPRTVPIQKKTDLFGNIHYSIRRLNEILTSFFLFFAAIY